MMAPTTTSQQTHLSTTIIACALRALSLWHAGGSKEYFETR